MEEESLNDRMLKRLIKFEMYSMLGYNVDEHFTKPELDELFSWYEDLKFAAFMEFQPEPVAMIIPKDLSFDQIKAFGESQYDYENDKYSKPPVLIVPKSFSDFETINPLDDIKKAYQEIEKSAKQISKRAVAFIGSGITCFSMVGHTHREYRLHNEIFDRYNLISKHTGLSFDEVQTAVTESILSVYDIEHFTSKMGRFPSVDESEAIWRYGGSINYFFYRSIGEFNESLKDSIQDLSLVLSKKYREDSFKDFEPTKNQQHEQTYRRTIGKPRKGFSQASNGKRFFCHRRAGSTNRRRD